MMTKRSKYIRLIPLMSHNLRRVYRKAKVAERHLGASWYPLMREMLQGWATEHNVPFKTVCAMTAAISPQVRWEVNLEIAQRLLETGLCSGATVLRRNAAIATNILRERHQSPIGFKSAPKVEAFYRNLCGDTTVATIDTHMLQACMGSPKATVTLNAQRYRSFEEALLRAARGAGVSPPEYQATVWLVWKRLYPTIDKRRLRT